MPKQKSLFEFINYVLTDSLPKKKYKLPAQYDKFYFLYAFDEVNYHRELKEYIDNHQLKSVYNIPYSIRKQIREKHYCLDENGNKKPKGDERHIYRISVLQKLLSKLYQELIFKINWTSEECYKQYGIAFYREDEQAEIDGTQMMSIKDRVILHLKLLKELKRNNNIQYCVNKVKERFGV